MKNEIMLQNGHKLLWQGGKLWKFVLSESWMPIYMTFDGNNIASIDSDGMGIPLYVGRTIDIYEAKSIIDIDGDLYVLMEEQK